LPARLDAHRADTAFSAKNDRWVGTEHAIFLKGDVASATGYAKQVGPQRGIARLSAAMGSFQLVYNFS
jgi:hypothetical protein